MAAGALGFVQRATRRASQPARKNLAAREAGRQAAAGGGREGISRGGREQVIMGRIEQLCKREKRDQSPA